MEKAAAIRGSFSSLKHDCSFQTERPVFYSKLRLCALAAIDPYATRPLHRAARFQEDILGRCWLNNETVSRNTRPLSRNLITRDRIDLFSANFLHFVWRGWIRGVDFNFDFNFRGNTWTRYNIYSRRILRTNAMKHQRILRNSSSFTSSRCFDLANFQTAGFVWLSKIQKPSTFRSVCF